METKSHLDQLRENILRYRAHARRAAVLAAVTREGELQATFHDLSVSWTELADIVERIVRDPASKDI